MGWNNMYKYKIMTSARRLNVSHVRKITCCNGSLPAQSQYGHHGQNKQYDVPLSTALTSSLAQGIREVRACRYCQMVRVGQLLSIQKCVVLICDPFRPSNADPR